MTTRTQGEVLEEVRFKTDDINGGRFKDDRLKAWINEGATDIARRTECLLTEDVSIEVEADTQSYTAPADVVRIHAVAYEPEGQNQRYDLDKIDVRGASNVAWTSVASTNGTPALYWLWSSPPTMTINLYPIPSVAGILRLYYYRTPAQLDRSGNTSLNTPLDIPQGWEDLIVDYCVYQALMVDKDPRWQQYKQFYEDHVAGLAEAATSYTDASGSIMAGGNYLPQWLYDPDYY